MFETFAPLLQAAVIRKKLLNTYLEIFLNIPFIYIHVYLEWKDSQCQPLLHLLIYYVPALSLPSTLQLRSSWSLAGFSLSLTVIL